VPDNLEPIGVEAVAEGVDSFLRQMRAMEAAYDDVQKAAGGLEGATKGTEGVFQRTGSVIGSILSPLSAVTGGVQTFTDALVGGAGLAVGMGAVNLAAGGLVSVFNTVVGAVQSAISTATGFVGQGMEMAGTFQEMEFAAMAVGRAMGLQQDEISGAIETLNEAGIRYDKSAKVVAQLAKNQIDLAKTTELAKIAQGAAILIGEDSSATMERLTYAIVSGSTEMFRAMGITVNNQAAYEKYAASIGVSADALTEQQKIAARTNEVIANSASLLDVYGAAMESPTKRLRSLTGRVLPEFSAALGAPFIDAWSTVIKAVSDFVGKLTDAVSEGGALYPVMVNLGAAASLLADAFANALGWVSDFITGLQTDLFGGLADTASGLYEWGMEMVVSLAEGIASAAETVLVGAMDAIGSVLSWWLGPGSPPRVAPGLTKWGTAALTEWLHGMTEADFSVLEDIQRPLQKALSAADFADISGDLIKAISAGTADESLFQKIAAATGRFGDEVARLTKMQFELAAANRAVAESEKRVDAGRKKVSDLTKEYNKMLREGASPEVLKAKLAEINAAEDELKLAEKQDKEAKARLSSIEDEVKLQDQVVGALMGVADAEDKAAKEQEQARKKAEQAQAKAAKAAARAAKLAEDPWDKFVKGYEEDMAVLEQQRALGIISEEDYLKARERLQARYVERAIRAGKPYETQLKALQETRAQLKAMGAEAGAPGALELPTPKFAVEDIQSRIGDAIEAAKGPLQEKLKGLFSSFAGPLTEAWEQSVSPTLSNIIEKFGWLSDLVGKSFDKLKEKALVAWNFIKDVVGSVVDVFVQETWPQLQAALAELEKAMAQLGITWPDVWRALGQAVVIVAKAIGVILLFLIGVVTGFVNAIAAAISTASRHWERLGGGIKTIIEGIAMAFGGAKKLIAGDLSGIVDIIKGNFKVIEGLFGTVVELIVTAYDVMISAAKAFVGGIISFFENLKERLVGGSIIPEMIDKFKSLITDLVDWAKRTIAEMVEKLIQKFQELKDKILQIIENFKNMVIEKMKLIIEQFNKLRDAVTEILNKLLEFAKLDKVFDALKTTLADLAEKILAFAKRIATALIPDWPFKLYEAFKGIRDFIGEAYEKLKAFLGTIADAVIPDWLMPGSPTPLELGLRGIADAMRELSTFELPRLNAAMTYSPAGAVTGGMTSTTSNLVNVTVPVGPIYMSGNADMATLEMTIERGVVKALTRRGLR
jgi:phage-related protein